MKVSGGAEAERGVGGGGGGGGHVYSSRGNSRTLALSDNPKTQ